MADLIKLLTDFREVQNLTQEEMADKLGISVRTYQTIEQTGTVKKVSLMNTIKNLLKTQNVSHENMVSEPAQTDYERKYYALLEQVAEERLKKIRELEIKKGQPQQVPPTKKIDNGVDAKK